MNAQYLFVEIVRLEEVLEVGISLLSSRGVQGQQGLVHLERYYE